MADDLVTVTNNENPPINLEIIAYENNLDVSFVESVDSVLSGHNSDENAHAAIINPIKDDINELNVNMVNKIDKITGKNLSTNDLTNGLKSNYDTAYQNSHNHSNKAALDLVSGTNTGDQNLGGLATISLNNINSSGQTVILNTIKNARYDSGWFAVTTNTDYTKTHNLGTSNFKYNVLLADDANGTNQRPFNYYYVYNAQTVGWLPKATTNNTMTIWTAFNYIGTNMNTSGITSGYYRIIAEAL